MKIHIEIVTGFLGAGKTSFINSLLKESLVDGEKVLVFQLEQGEKNIVHSSNISNFVRIQDALDIKDLKEKMIYSIKNINLTE
ncbi:G3E family GTPase [Clostridium beijerinckii]|uniref:GTP-binding protein n=1 Tax=Clostridium beijerinckii TaxID=1520 RepID=UPI00237B89D2|nr:GTP-binding protein [Clostridium beijerinckii]NRV17775.1 G3E family GTPase [Clostridium beijerinckii]